MLRPCYGLHQLWNVLKVLSVAESIDESTVKILKFDWKFAFDEYF